MEMAPTTTDTPLRRSNVFRTPLSVPINNDDEEERRLSRRRTLHEDPETSISESTVEDNAQLQNFLKIYQENKISKDNAWNVGLIDTFAHMMARHNKMMKNFQIVGSTLEASSKVYGLRVDSVHMDTVRMTAGLSRQKTTSRIDDDQNDQSMIETNNEVEVNDNLQPDRPQPKKKKTRRQVSTVTKNVDTINGKLDTVPFTDPVFAKLNSVVGNLYSTTRLLYCILPTDNSQLRLRSDYLAWDFTTAEEITEFDEDIYRELPLNALMEEFEELKDHVLRPRNGGYKILNTPADDDDETDVLPESRKSLNHSAVAFDINAEIEPINSQPDFLDVDVDNHFEDELTIEDRFAIQACRGLRRPPVLIENLAPVDASTLEYSYRPLDNINQFWAGPSHWKFKKLSIGGQPVGRITTDGTTDKTKRKRVAKKTLKNKLQELTFDDEDDKLLVLLDTMNNLRQVNYKKWDPKKLKLPTNYKLDRNCFNVFKYAQSLSVNACEVGGTVDIPSSNYEYDNAVDRDYCPNNDADTDDAASDVHLDHQHQNDDLDIDNIDNENDSDLNATMAAISHQFEGAPNKVGKIPIPFSTRAKMIDMKRLKICCLDIINETADSNILPIADEVVVKLAKTHIEKYKCGAVSFNSVYVDLPKKISQLMAENLSTSTAFYSILHLANDYSLRLVQQEDLKDFQILRIE